MTSLLLLWLAAAPAPSVVWSVDDADQLIEGIAIEPKTHHVLIGSVRHRTVLEVDAKGTAKPWFKEGAVDAGGFFGMAVSGGSLWAATTWLPQVHGYTAEKKNSAALVQLALDGKHEATVFPVPKDDQPHAFGDVAAAPDGTIFVSDSLLSGIYRLEKGALVLWMKCPFKSLQGLAFSADGKTLFASGYVDGLFAIDVQARQAKPLENGKIRGVDGVYRTRDGLLVTQNGGDPMAVVTLTLDHQTVRVLGKLPTGAPSADDLSLGTLDGDRFILAAQAGWNGFDDDGAPKPNASPKRTVLSIPLR